MNEAAAKAAIDTLQLKVPDRLTRAYADRAKVMIDDPHEVNQSYYGTCGPVSAMYLLLRRDRAKFINLVTAVFDPGNPVFNGIRVAPERLYEARREEIRKKSAMYPPPGGPDGFDHTYDFDFIVAGSLYVFLQQKEPELFRQQRDYSESIVRLVGASGPELVLAKFLTDLTPALAAGVTEVPGVAASRVRRRQADPELIRVVEAQSDTITKRLGYRLDGLKIVWVQAHDTEANRWTIVFGTDRGYRDFVIRKVAAREFHLAVDLPVESGGIGFATGDLALNQDGIKALMDRVVGIPTTFVQWIDSTAEKTVRAHLAGPGSYAIAMIKGYDQWCGASKSATARTFSDAASPPPRIEGRTAPDIEHHLVVHGITDNDKYREVDVWSWGQRYTVSVFAPHLRSYFYGFLLV